MANKAVFLDRDNTLIADPGYISDPDQVKLLDGVPETLAELGKMGYKLVVVSNQSAVARGIVTERGLGKIHKRLERLLAQNDAYLDKIYYCPYHPEGTIEKYRKESKLRKPNPGMLLTAAKEMALSLKMSWIVGNSSRDIEAGRAAGCKTILVDNPLHSRNPQGEKVNPDFRAVNIREVVNIIKKHERLKGFPKMQSKTTPQVDPETAHSQIEQSVQQNDDGLTKTTQLLSGILDHLKKIHRSQMFEDFSMMRLMASIVQVVVLFCLLMSVWFLMSPAERDGAAMFALGFALVFQTMALTFYVMQSKK